MEKEPKEHKEHKEHTDDWHGVDFTRNEVSEEDAIRAATEEANEMVALQEAEATVAGVTLQVHVGDRCSQVFKSGPKAGQQCPHLAPCRFHDRRRKEPELEEEDEDDEDEELEEPESEEEEEELEGEENEDTEAEENEDTEGEEQEENEDIEGEEQKTEGEEQKTEGEAQKTDKTTETVEAMEPPGASESRIHRCGF